MSDKDIESLSYKELREKCIMQGLSARGTRKQLIIKLQSHSENKPHILKSRVRSRRTRTTTDLSYAKPLPPLSLQKPKMPFMSKSISSNNKVPIAVIEESDSEELEEDRNVNIEAKSIPSLKKTASAPVVVKNMIKRKRLYWTPIPPKLIIGSIWERLSQMQETIDIDSKQFELHFQLRQKKPINTQKLTTVMRHKKCNLKKKKIVSKKRYDHILSVLKELNIENMDKLRKILLNMDEIWMNTDRLNKLISIIPSVEEQNKSSSMLDGTSTDLVCTFMYTMSGFYELEQRLRIWMFKLHFIEIVDSLWEQYAIMGITAQKLCESESLHLLLSIILRFGNDMNKKKKELALGFNVEILTKLSEIMSLDHTRSLLMYIYSFCDRKYPSALCVLSELRESLKSAISIDIGMLNKVHSMLVDHVAQIKGLIHSDCVEQYADNDRFIMVLTEFYAQSTRKLNTLNVEVKNVKLSMKYSMMLYRFGSQGNHRSIESFYRIWWKFIQDFGASKEKLIKLENDRLVRMEKRKKQRNIEKYMDIESIDDEKYTSSIGKEVQKRTSFKKYQNDLHFKLKDAVKRRADFIQNEGILPSIKEQNDTMKKLATMYQQRTSANINKETLILKQSESETFVDDTYHKELKQNMKLVNQEMVRFSAIYNVTKLSNQCSLSDPDVEKELETLKSTLRSFDDTIKMISGYVASCK